MYLVLVFCKWFYCTFLHSWRIFSVGIKVQVSGYLLHYLPHSVVLCWEVSCQSNYPLKGNLFGSDYCEKFLCLVFSHLKNNVPLCSFLFLYLSWDLQGFSNVCLIPLIDFEKFWAIISKNILFFFSLSGISVTHILKDIDIFTDPLYLLPFFNIFSYCLLVFFWSDF